MPARLPTNQPNFYQYIDIMLPISYILIIFILNKLPKGLIFSKVN